MTFVGRGRELRRLRRLLDERRHVVVTGPYGSGRTALVRRLEHLLKGAYRFFWFSRPAPRQEVRRLIAASHDGPRVVAVFDEIERVTPRRLALWRELAISDQMTCLAIVEAFVPGPDVLRLRAALGAAPVIRLGPLGASAVERWVTEHCRHAGLAWTPDDVRGLVRSTHGCPLIVRLSLEATTGSREGRGLPPWVGSRPPLVRRPREIAED